MAFWDDAKKKVLQAMKPRQQEEHQVLSNRADGGFSGYQPKVNRQQVGQGATGFQQAAPAGIENMMPIGVDKSMMQQFQPVGGQTGAFTPQGAPVQGMPPQGQFGQTGFQPPVNQPRPQAQFQGSGPQQPARPGFGQPAFKQNMPPQGSVPPQAQQVPPQAMPPRGFTTSQPPVQPQQPVVPNDGHTFAFPGESFMVDGHVYKMVVRVAQITGVPSCFRVIEFMYNNEAVIVNAEQITDLVEADRCMDLIFGAACAMKQRLMRVSGKQIYLITPPQVYVAPFDSLRRAGMEDIERRWPGAMQANMPVQPMNQQPVVNNVQPAMGGQPMGGQPMQQTMFNRSVAPNQGQPRQDDFAGGFGRRVARNAMHTNGYTDYGGFGMKTR